MRDDSSPTARALLTLDAIHSAPGITAERLGTRLGVSDRAARRYVGMLREAGIPVESATGRYGGYRIGRGLRVPLGFSTAEALGLLMAVLQGWHGSIEVEHPAATAVAKIMRVLPRGAAGSAEALRRVRAHNPGDAAAMPDPELVAAVAQTCEARRVARIGYRAASGRTSRSIVDPWAVVVRHGRWYLLCRSRRSDEPRVLRLDRITAFGPTDAWFEPPDDLDPVRVVEERLTEGWAYACEVRIEAPADEVAAWLPRALGRVSPSSTSTCRLEGSTDDPVWYAAQLALVPAPFTIVRGDEVRAEVRLLAGRLARAAGAARSRT